MSKTIVYWDVDGVINSFYQSDAVPTGWEGDWKKATVMGYIIHWYTDLVEEMNKLSKQENVEFKWLTTWQENAVSELCDPLGIEGKEWEVLFVPEGQELFNRKSWWKLHALKADVTQHNPDKVVWIDDDFKYARDALTWVEDHPEINLLPISPHTDLGMTKEDFNDIIEFINS